MTVTGAASDLLLLLADISRREFAGEWPDGIEYQLWDMAVAGATDEGRRLAELARKADGWWQWSDDAMQMLWRDLPDWLWLAERRRFAARRAS